jgi:CheY-like chemotaxis protein
MNLLVVEDDETNIAFFLTELAEPPGIQIIIAKSRDSAIEQLQARSFDLVVLDLKIPTTDGALDAANVHGMAVRTAVLEGAKGTPVTIFTAHPDLVLVKDLIAQSEKHDIWGDNKPRTMTLFLLKTDFAECLQEIRDFRAHCMALTEIEISVGTDQIVLSGDEKKVLRIFARLYGGRNIRLHALGGGLSDARTFRVEVQDGQGAISCNAVAKLGKIADLEQEHNCFKQYILPGIKIAGFAHVINFIQAGASNTGGLFYGLAAEHNATLVDVMKQAPDSVHEIVPSLKALEATWQKQATVRQITVGEVRAGLISNAAFHPLAGQLPFDWSALEQIAVSITQCCQHCDLHGLNILVKNGIEPLLIDYASAGIAPASLDPLVLELSLLFHPTCRSLCPKWPTLEQAKHWDDLDVFTAGCPLEKFIRACRRWAVDAESRDKGRYATVYAFAVRQLKFPDVDHSVAVAVAEAAHRRLTEG